MDLLVQINFTSLYSRGHAQRMLGLRLQSFEKLSIMLQIHPGAF